MTATALSGARPGVAESDPAGVTGVELRHLRYFVALADTGTFTHAAELMYVAQPTLSQQIRRLEDLIGTPLVLRGREGVQLTQAGTILLEESRMVLSLFGHGLDRTRHAAGLDHPRLRFSMPGFLPEVLAVRIASQLRSACDKAGVDVEWLESPDAGLSAVRERQVDAGVGWLDANWDELSDPLDVMRLGSFEPIAWVRESHPAAIRGQVSLAELLAMDVLHGPRRACPEACDAWLAVLRGADPRFSFSDPPLRQSLPVTLAFASSGTRPTAVLTGPQWALRASAPDEPLHEGAGQRRTCGMVPVRIEGRPLTATAALGWISDLPRDLQQVLFDTAADIAF